MMFLLDLAFATELLVFGVGIGFLVWASRNDGSGIGLARLGGYLISILAVFALLCTSYYGITYWVKGYFKTPMTHMTMMKPKMMELKHSMHGSVEQKQE